MKSYKEMCDSLFERREQYLFKRKQTAQKWIRYGIPAVCVFLVFVLGTSYLQISPPAYFAPSPSLSVDSSSLANPPSSAVQSFATSNSSHNIASSYINESSVNQAESSTIVSDSGSAPNEIEQSGTIGNSYLNYDRKPSGNRKSIVSISEFEEWLYITYSDRFKEDSSSQSKVDSPSEIPPGAEPDVSSPSVKPEVSFPDESLMASDSPPAAMPSQPPVLNKTFVDNAYSAFFSGGSLCVPSLLEGNDTFDLYEVMLNDNGLFYQYYYKQTPSDRYSGSIQLQIVCFADLAEGRKGYTLAKKDQSAVQYQYRNITFYAVKNGDARQSHTIFWSQGGRYYVANLYDVPSLLPSLPQLLYMTTIHYI